MDTVMNAGEVAQVAIIERWGWWQGALADPSKIGTEELPIHPGEYQLGYYRTRRKNGPWEPVGIYPDENGVVVAFRGDRQVDDIPELFQWCCRHPVSYEAYIGALEGENWPDDDPTVAAQIAPKPATIGDNSGYIDEAEVLRDQIEAAQEGADAYKKITDDAALAKAQSLRSRLLELSGEATKKHKAEKAPHLEAGRAVDKKWFPLRDAAKDTADAIRAAMGEWETEKLHRQREAEREAEQKRLKAEAEAAKAAEAGKPAPDPGPAPAVAPVSVAPAPIKGTYGKAASVSVKVVVKEVTDWTKLATYMSGHPETQDLLRKLAQRALDAGRTDIPGITTAEEASVR